MEKFKCVNGWTRETMLEHVQNNFKEKSTDGLSCVYRGSNGNKCAAGLFIPDECYNKDMENKVVATANCDSEFYFYFFFKSEWFPLNAKGMISFQHAHDNSKKETTKQNLINWINNNVAEEIYNENTPEEI